MAIPQDLMGVGIPSEQALRLGLQKVALSAAGTAQGTATPIMNGNVLVAATPASSQQGLRLPANAEIDSVIVVYPTAATPLISVYPSTGQTIDLLSANAPITFATANKNAVFRRVSATNWRSFISGAV